MSEKLKKFTINKTWKVVIFSGLGLLSLWVGISIFKSVVVEEKTWFNYVDVTGNEVDNNYNNYLSGGDLCRIGDKLYFNYRKNEWHYGLMEISSQGSRRLVWHGPHPDLKGLGFHIEQICKFNGSFYRINDKGTIDIFDLNKNNFKEIGVSVYSRDVLAFIDDKIYYLKKSSNTSNESLNLIQRNYDGTEIIIAQEVFYFYISNNKVYYSKSINSTESEILEYDLKNKKEKVIVSYTPNSEITYDIFEFMVENGYLILTKNIRHGDSQDPSTWSWDHKLCKCKIEDNTSIEEIQDIHYPNFSYNAYQGNLYICSDSGIDIVNIETNERKNLTNSYARNCYIVDDEWVYFTGENSILWRITNDGTITEKVFG